MTRLDVDEVDVHPVDLGRELRQRVQPRRAPAQVVVVRPVTSELLHRRQAHTLRPVGHELLGGPTRVANTPPQLVDRLVGNFNGERTDLRHWNLQGLWADGRRDPACNPHLTWGKSAPDTRAKWLAPLTVEVRL